MALSSSAASARVQPHRTDFFAAFDDAALGVDATFAAGCACVSLALCSAATTSSPGRSRPATLYCPGLTLLFLLMAHERYTDRANRRRTRSPISSPAHHAVVVGTM